MLARIILRFRDLSQQHARIPEEIPQLPPQLFLASDKTKWWCALSIDAQQSFAKDPFLSHESEVKSQDLLF